MGDNSRCAVWARRRGGGVARAPLVAPSAAVVYPTGMDRGAGDLAAAPSAAFGQASRTCFQTAVVAAGTYQTRYLMARARDAMQLCGAKTALHVAVRIAAAVPFGDKVALRVAELQVAAGASFWANVASRIAVTLVWVTAMTAVTVANSMISCEPPAAR